MYQKDYHNYWFYFCVPYLKI